MGGPNWRSHYEVQAGIQTAFWAVAEERRSVRASSQASAGNEDRRAYGKTLYPSLHGKLIPRTIPLPLFTEKIHNLLSSSLKVNTLEPLIVDFVLFRALLLEE